MGAAARDGPWRPRARINTAAPPGPRSPTRHERPRRMRHALQRPVHRRRRHRPRRRPAPHAPPPVQDDLALALAHVLAPRSLRPTDSTLSEALTSRGRDLHASAACVAQEQRHRPVAGPPARRTPARPALRRDPMRRGHRRSPHRTSARPPPPPSGSARRAIPHAYTAPHPAGSSAASALKRQVLTTWTRVRGTALSRARASRSTETAMKFLARASANPAPVAAHPRRVARHDRWCRASRRGSNAAHAAGRACPVTRSATSRPVTGASIRPSMLCPDAR
jgi:hypothetical protein